ncbi:MAG: hypothetical protein WAU60_13595 [Candidatus Competibacter denitrificans]
MRFKQLVTLLFVLTTATVATVSQAKDDRDDDHETKPQCTNANLRGSYGFVAKGVILAGSPLPSALQGSFASGGTATFDGKGNFVLTSTSSFNGFIQPVETRGTYQVNSDCSYTSRADNGITFQAVILDGGRQLQILQTTPNVVIAGTAIRQPQRCEAKFLQAAYGFTAEGAAGPPTLPVQFAGPLAGVGTVVFAKDGTFVLTATRSVNGILDPEPLALNGVYSMKENCAFDMHFEVGFTFDAMIVNNGKEILFIETDPGTALIVKATRL